MASEWCHYIGKTSWPELVGTNGEYAASVIKGENSNLIVFVVLDGTRVTEELKCDRVRVWVDGNRTVIKSPTIG